MKDDKSKKLHCAVGYCFRIPTAAYSIVNKRPQIELSQDGGRVDFSKNLRASLFNNDTYQTKLISAGSIAEQYL
jgi:hypothetical protein